MAGIFISYRRDDSAGFAGRLYDSLCAAFPGDKIFIDVERLCSGDDFAREIEGTLRACDVCLVMIGPRWLKAADQYGRRRLDQPNDWVRIEIGAALTRNVRVIPLLVDEAVMPPGEALPPDLVRLSSLQARVLHHYTFTRDVDALVQGIRQASDARRSLAASMASLKAGCVRVHPVDQLEYAWIPPGRFMMGRVPGDGVTDERYDDEKPRHPVQLTQGFWLSRGPVTAGAYGRFVRSRGIAMPPPPKHNPNWADHDHPVVNVTWAEAREYCAWVGGRLPSEAQWEYAARGGHADTCYPWGNEITPDCANYADNTRWQGTSPVGSFAPNDFNLFDVAGNVWEWVSDWYDAGVYAARPPREPTMDPDVQVDVLHKRVVRGGSWDSIPIEVRISNRGYCSPSDCVRDFGFRVLLDELPATEPDPS